MLLAPTALLRNLALGTSALVGAAAPVLAADVATDLHIDRVTVYRQGAVVTRTGDVALPAGSNRLVIRGLPAAIDPKTLRVTVDSPSVQLGGVELAKINEGKFVSEPERELRRKIEETTDQRVAVQDEIATAQTQLKLLDSLAANPAGSATKPSVDTANLGALLATMATSANAAHKHVRDANLQLRTLDRELDKLKADLSKVATTSKQSTEVRASLDASAAVTANATVSYTVADAGWDWIYQARLDTGKKRVSLERQGSVRQGSGEDWKNVELTLTTALPAADVATPVVGSLYLDLQVPQPPAEMFGVAGKRSLSMQMPAPAPAAAAMQEIAVTAGRRPTVASTDYVADYKIPSRVVLLADREPRLYPIGEDAFDADLVARVVPSASHAAHLEAVFKYQEQLPIEAGQLELYRDGAFVGAAEINAFLPGADVRMPFGADERIRVAVRDEQAQSGQRGVISKQTIKETRQRFDITSFHPAPITVEVIDRIPVSRNSDIHVEVLKGATDATVRDVDGKPGVLLWRLEAQPQKTVSVRHYYSVQYPAGRQLEQNGVDAPE
ncbi:MAG: mucoidy inhibitor MuiA family protein [Steroidobacteraceae bacterium]|jgi:uncharacterized protein (TIGR02231 family)